MSNSALITCLGVNACPAGSGAVLMFSSSSSGLLSESSFYTPAGSGAQSVFISPNPPAGF